MRPLTYYIDRLITFAYVASLIGGVIVCTTVSTNAVDSNKKYVNIRSVASASDIDHMSADDFLLDTEKAADREDLKEYLNKLRKNGVNDNADDADPDALDDEALWGDDESSKDDEPDDTDKDPTEVIEIDPDDWHLMLVNKQNPVPEDFEVNLAKINGSMYADERIIEDIYRMMDAAADDGIDLMICSAYRSYDRQRVLFNNKINKLMGQGMTYLESYKVGSMSVTVPGTSEHHLGLALDILTGSYTEMDDGFGETEAGKWLAANSADYGFILRYPQGKEDITGIIYEPWHFRYVGEKYAKDITERGVCLEEYLKGGL